MSVVLSLAGLSYPWTFYEKDAVWKDENTYVFCVKNMRSNNGTIFTEGKRQITLLLDFGFLEQVGIKTIVSIADLY